ncbi:MAG TPA: histidine kinase dimerization/phospho-acceptor domain-containing protein, partial [Herpetosiphonaceae bacterium]
MTLPPAISAWTVSLRQQLSEQIQTFEDTRLRIENNVQTMQAATRGYVITQQPAFLNDYGTAASHVPTDLAQLQDLASTIDPRLVPQVTALAERVVQWQADGPEQQIALVQEENLAGAVANISTGRSQQRFDGVLEDLRLLNTEILRIDADLSARINRVRTVETVLTFSLGLLGIGLGVYLVRIFRGVARLTRESEELRERAEQAVVTAEAANAAVVREQQRLQAVFDQSPEGILFAEASSRRIVLANQAARTLLDDPLPLSQPLSTSVIERLYRANGEAAQPDEIPLHRALAGTAQIGVELTIEQRSGQRVPVLFNAVPLHNAAGEMEGAVAVFQDLSRFREVERLKSDFVAMVSHELRTPLTAIQGCVQSLLYAPNTHDPQRTEEFLVIIEAQSARLHDLIDNLLDMSQLEAGVFRLRVGPVQPGHLIRSVARHANGRLPERRVQ